MSKSASFLQRWPLRQKLIGGFTVFFLSMAAGSVFAAFEIHGLTSVVSRAAIVHRLTAIGTIASDMISLDRSIILNSIFDDKAGLQRDEARLTDTIQTFSRSLDSMNGAPVSQHARDSIRSLRSRFEAWMSMHNDVAAALRQQQVDVAEKKIDDPLYTSAVNDMRQLATEMSEYESQALEAEASNANSTSMVGLALLSLLSLVTGILVLIFENGCSRTLSRLIRSLAGSSERVETLAAGVQSASESLAHDSSSQAATLEQTSASGAEITAMTHQNAENSRMAASVMIEVDERVKAGNRTLESMVVSMREINASSDKISKIIKVIDEIAFQTNILALNAAVEAARAGEAGMGFAVVADEVRGLAQRSAQAARDTSVMIEDSIAKSSEGSTKLQQLSEMVAAITESAARVKTLVDSVSVGSAEQARGIEQVSKAVTQMEQTTQHTAAGSEQSAAASHKLSAEARDLNRVVSELRLMVDGAGSGA